MPQRKSAAEMVYWTSFTLPAQLAVSQELQVEEILWTLATAEPLPTQHGQVGVPTMYQHPK
jgi:hypothetical protein